MENSGVQKNARTYIEACSVDIILKFLRKQHLDGKTIFLTSARNLLLA